MEGEGLAGDRREYEHKGIAGENLQG